MSAPAFTPGPITVTAGGYALNAAHVGSGYFGNIGVAVQRDPHPHHGGGISDATARANAVLWAAAPGLYEACELLVERFDGMQARELLEAIAEDPSLLLDCYNRALAAYRSAGGAL